MGLNIQENSYKIEYRSLTRQIEKRTKQGSSDPVSEMIGNGQIKKKDDQF